MKNAEWNNLRARLHHDWLQNRYMTFLESWKDCFDDAEKCGSNKNDVLEQLLQWKNKKDAFQILINECEDALSPQQLLNEPPLDSMSDENKKWLGEVIHALFCIRTGIKDKTVDLQRSIDEVDEIVNTVERGLRSGNETKEAMGDEIISTFVNFSKKISELPHEIQVV
ncbi:MAG: hypothetical protein ACE5GV_05230 [Candidatus Scalindua sp.]